MEAGGILCSIKHGTEVGMEVDFGRGGVRVLVLGNKEKTSREKGRRCRGEKESERNEEPFATLKAMGFERQLGKP